VLHAFPEALRLAHALARELGGAVAPLELHRFPDGESLVRVAHEAQAPAVVLRSLDDPNAKLVEVLLAADALRRAGAGPLTLVAPYLAYMRQDRVFRSGEPVSQQVVGRLLGEAFDRVLTVEAHLHRVASLDAVVPGRAASLPAAPVLATWLRAHAADALLVGPDAESEPWLRRLATAVGAPCCVGRKERRGDAEVVVSLPELPPGSRHAVLVDDIASTGATLAAAARGLRAAGITRVEAVVVHALFAPGARKRLHEAGIERVVSSDTIPDETNAVSVAPLLAEALREG